MNNKDKIILMRCYTNRCVNKCKGKVMSKNWFVRLFYTFLHFLHLKWDRYILALKREKAKMLSVKSVSKSNRPNYNLHRFVCYTCMYIICMYIYVCYSFSYISYALCDLYRESRLRLGNLSQPLCDSELVLILVLQWVGISSL